MTEKIGRREGVGNKLADGVKVAWEKLGKIGTEYAIHIQGEEIPAHDPKYTPGLATTYWLTATPGRHTQGGELIEPPHIDLPELEDSVYTGRADNYLRLMASMEVLNSAGLCMFGYISYPIQTLPDQLAAGTGWAFDMEEVYHTGMRIYTMRHAFNLREGINPLTRNVPGRLVGEPPLKEGNVKEVTLDYKTMAKEFLELAGWDVHTTVPSEESLRELGLDFLVDDMEKVSVPAV
jgi:aldehyde:ferredoxin oxidoreductase